MDYGSLVIGSNSVNGGSLKKRSGGGNGGGSDGGDVFLNTNTNNWLEQQNSANASNVTNVVNHTSSLVGGSTVPVIEIATYADTDVYECYIRGFESRIVMRRKNNDWVNITQVFKLASFTKTKRTKVLEKESSDIEHEKVQGGYGRFQGTWVPLEAAKYLIEKYSIEDPVVSAIIDFELDPNNPPPKRCKNSVLKRGSPGIKIQSPSSYNKTPKKKTLAVTGSSVQGNGVNKKGKKLNSGSGSSLLQMNPSPLHNIVFQTPQQLNSRGSNNNNNTNTYNEATDATLETLSATTGEDTRMDSAKGGHQFEHNRTPLAHGYNATQKPLQFYSGPSGLSCPQLTNKNQANDQPESHKRHHDTPFLSFLPDSKKSAKFINGTQQTRIDPVNNSDRMIEDSANKKRKKMNGNGSAENDMNLEDEFSQKIMFENVLSVQDKTQKHFQYMKQQMMSKNSAKLKELDRLESQMNLSNAWNMNSFTNGNPNVNDTTLQTTFDPNNSSAQNKGKNNNQVPILSEQEYKELMLQTLSSEITSSSYSLPMGLFNPPESLDIDFDVDDQGHSALHWAAAMSNIPLIKLLISLNANLTKCNKKGFNCVTKLLFYNNCHNANSIKEILSLLKVCIISADDNNRLPLHYLVELTVNRSKDPVVINSYMEAIVKILAEDDYHLLKLCLNYQDNMGNTVMHLAALNLNIDLCNKLAQLGSSMDIINFESETPSFILSKLNSINIQANPNGFFSPAFDPTIQLQRGFPSPDRNKVGSNSNQMGEYSHSQNITASSPLTFGMKKEATNDITNVSAIMEDISSIDALVTSSVVKADQSLQSTALKNSPMLYKAKSIPLTKEPSTNKQMLLEAGNSPIVPIGFKTQAHTPKSNSAMVKLANDLTFLTTDLTRILDDQSEKSLLEIKRADNDLINIEKHTESIEHQKKILLSTLSRKLPVENFDELRTKSDQIKLDLEEAKRDYVKYLEKLHSKQLKKCIEEEKAKKSETDSTSDEASTAELNEELKKQKAERQTLLKSLAELVATSDSTPKIAKYKRLLGMTVEDVESKLDAIENDLRLQA